MSKDDLKLDLIRDTEIELMKDFLRLKGYKRTLECLIKEDRYKQIENRNLQVSIYILIQKNNYYNKQTEPIPEEEKISKFTKCIKESNHRTIQLSKVIDGYRLL